MRGSIRLPVRSPDQVPKIGKCIRNSMPTEMIRSTKCGDHWQPRSAGEGRTARSRRRVCSSGDHGWWPLSRPVRSALSIIGQRHALRTEIQMDRARPCVPSRPRRSTHARPRDTHGAPRGGRRGRRRVRTIVVEDTERPPRVLIRVRHKLSETPKLCCARLMDRSCRAHANRVCVA